MVTRQPFEKGFQPHSLRLPERGDLIPTLGPPDDRTQGDDNDRDQGMEFGSLDPRVFQRGKMLGQSKVGR